MEKSLFDLQIQETSISTAVSISQMIPELKDPYSVEEYERRLKDIPHLLLAAYVDQQPAGFKVGYEREGNFYSWMGGVLPGYRRLGVAKALADYQEKWAHNQAYDQIVFKTRNVHKAMLIFALQNGFEIIRVDTREPIAQNRIWLRKQIR